MPKLLKPIYLLTFVTLPQTILGLYLLFFHLHAQTTPTYPLMVLFLLQAGWNIFIIVLFWKSKASQRLDTRLLKGGLPALILIFSVALILMFHVYNGRDGISPEIVYLFLNSISLLYLILALSSEIENLDLKKQAVFCLVIPIATALLSGLNIYLFQINSLLLMASVGLFCGFVFFFCRFLYASLPRKKPGSPEEQKETAEISRTKMSLRYRVVIAVVAIILPLAGLTLNNGGLFSDLQSGGIFGDFSSKWFYVIAAANGLLMLVDTKSDRLSLFVFYGKMTGFTYIAYFTLVFIPILPLGLVGIFFFGLGFLAFVPLAVFILELLQLKGDLKKLRPKFGLSVVFAAILGLCTLPAILAANFYLDKVNFTNALTYLNGQLEQNLDQNLNQNLEQQPTQNPDVNLRRLQTSLRHISAVSVIRETGGPFINGGAIPLVTKIYQAVAMEDKTISPDTAEKMAKTFLRSNAPVPVNFRVPPTQNVKLEYAAAHTEFDGQNGVYKTWVDLEIINNSGQSLAEYQTTFSLPEGCFIKDYYLYVDGQKKAGLLADKRAALTAYNTIIRTPKDPGIIYYKSGDFLELRVYPFAPGELRKTGFLVLHSQEETLRIDGLDIPLTAESPRLEPLDMPGISFVPADYKSSLSPVDRQAKYCFLLDSGQNSAYEEQVRKAQEFIRKHQIKNSVLYNVSYKVNRFAEGPLKQEGGFNLPLALKIASQDIQEGEFPIIIAVSDNFGNAPALENDNFTGQYPESQYYYNLGYDLSLTPYTFNGNVKQEPVEDPLVQKALLYKGGFVADDNRNETVITGPIGEYTANEYYNAFLLQKKSLTDNGNELIRDSFRQKLLTKHTAFTVLETAEQENYLLGLQEDFLNGKQPEAPAVMGEPNLLVCLLIASLVIICLRSKAASGVRHLQ